MMATVMIYSCQDNFEEASNEQGIADAQGAVSRSGSLRSNVRNGRLYFETEDQLKGHYESLSRLIGESKGDEEAIFEEAEVGYRSLRTHLTKEEVTEIYDDGSTEFAEEYILVDLRSSMLNEYAEVQVGETVYVYYTEDMVFQIPANDELSIENFRAIKKRNGNEIPVEILNNGIGLVSNSAGLSWHTAQEEIIDSDKTSGTSSYSVYTYSLPLSFNNVNCSIFDKKLDFFLQRTEIEYENGVAKPPKFKAIKADFTIDYKDGNTDSFSSKYYVSVTHTFAMMGTFKPEVTVTFSDPDALIFNGSATATYSDIIVASACNQTNQSYNPWVYSNNKAMESKIWFKNDFFGTHAGARTISYKRKSNGNHVRERAYVYAEINATFRNNNCQALTNKRNTKDCNNCKDKTSRVNSILNYDRKDISNGDIFSEHEIRNDGVIIKRTYVLNPC